MRSDWCRRPPLFASVEPSSFFVLRCGMPDPHSERRNAGPGTGKEESSPGDSPGPEFSTDVIPPPPTDPPTSTADSGPRGCALSTSPTSPGNFPPSPEKPEMPKEAEAL